MLSDYVFSSDCHNIATIMLQFLLLDLLTGICIVATMDYNSQQLLYRVLTDATSQVYQAMLERVQRGEALGLTRGYNGNVSHLSQPALSCALILHL